MQRHGNRRANFVGSARLASRSGPIFALWVGFAPDSPPCIVLIALDRALRPGGAATQSRPDRRMDPSGPRPERFRANLPANQLAHNSRDLRNASATHP